MDNNFLSIKNRRAVAPIIATLILVAIAVVGGVMIFVFAQDFFGGEAIEKPGTIDIISLAGYDLRDVAATAVLANHLGTIPAAPLCVGCVAGGNMAVTDIGTLFIKNSGSSAVTIQSITINDKKYTLDVGGVGAGLLTQEFTVYTETLVGGTMQIQADATIGGKDTGTIHFRSADAIGAGRTISVTTTTGTGQDFSFNVVIGQKS